MTEKQKIFANEYLIDLNATRAYKAAYPNCVKDETASTNGSRMLRNDKVVEYIKKRQKALQIETCVTQEMVINELAAIAFVDVTDIVQLKGKRVKFTNTEDLSNHQKKAIAGIKKVKNGIELSVFDKLKALELLGKHLGMYTDKIKVDASVETKGKLGAILDALHEDEHEDETVT